MTNEQYVKLLSRKQLAELLIQKTYQEEIDYDWDENSYISGYCIVYVTSDGQEYLEDYESALQHECWWLAQENKGGINDGS